MTAQSRSFVRHALLSALIGLSPAVAVGQDDAIVVQNGEIQLSVDPEKGMPIADFVKLAQQITGRAFAFDANELQGPQATIRFVGTASIKKEEFLNFFQTMLYARGFACVPRGAGGDEIVEIISMQGPRRGEVAASARYVPSAALEEYSDQAGVMIITSVQLEHINAQMANNALRPFFAQASNHQQALMLGSLGDSRTLLLQGFGPQVAAGYKMIKLADVPATDADQETRVLPLSYATADELEAVLQQLLAQSAQRAPGGQFVEADVKMTAHTRLNAIVVSGSRSRVLEVANLVAKLDAPKEAPSSNIHVVALQHADAMAMQQLLRDFAREELQSRRQSMQGQPNVAAMRPTVIRGHAKTNSLLVSAEPQDLKRIVKLIETLDKPSPQQKEVAFKQDGGDIVLSVAPGKELSVLDFIRLAHSVTGHAFTFQKGDVEIPGTSLSLVGTVRVKEAAFMEFFENMLATRGFGVFNVGDENSGIREIRRTR